MAIEVESLTQIRNNKYYPGTKTEIKVRNTLKFDIFTL